MPESSKRAMSLSPLFVSPARRMRSSRERPPKPPGRARQIWGENLNGVLRAAMNRTSTSSQGACSVLLVNDANACNLVALANTDEFLNRRRWRADNHAGSVVYRVGK